jgi:hypothetical protein
MLSTDKDKLQILKNSAHELVRKWTEKAQTSCLSDAERAVYYECAEELNILV